MKRVLTLAKGGFALILLCALIVWVSPGKILAAFSHLTPFLVGYLLFISFVLIFISALKWKVLLQGLGRTENVWRLYGYYLVGYFVNLLLPSYLGGDAVRSWYVGRVHGQHKAFTATVLERFLGIVAMLILACTFMWFVPLIPTSVRITVVVFSCSALAGTLFALSPYSLHILGKIPVVGPKVYSHGKLLHESLLCIWSQKGVIGEALLLSMVFHTITVVNVLASGWAVGWIDAPIFELFVVLPVILIVSAVPVTPQAIGFQEGVFVFYLTQLGATLEQALGVALIVRAKSYILAGLGSIIWVSERALGHKISGDGVPTA